MDTLGTTFRFTSFGESHGPAVGGIIDGCPAGVVPDMRLISSQLQRRAGGAPSCPTTKRKEDDDVEWLGGLLNGITTGAPLAFLVRNRDARSGDYDVLKDKLRPGHGEYPRLRKFGITDYRGGGRNSGRITASWVVAGSIAQQILMQQGIVIAARLLSKGIVGCTATSVPAGWGSPAFGSLKAMFAQAMMSIPSATAFEMGLGTKAAELSGTDYADAWDPQRPFCTLTNHCGGVQGGLSNGMPIELRVTFHAPVTQPGLMRCADAATGTIEEVKVTGRHDQDHTSRCLPIVESLTALVLVQFSRNQPGSHS